MPQRTSPLAYHCTTERAHVVLFLALFITLTLAQVLCALSHPSPCFSREWLSLFDSTHSTLFFSAFLLSVFLFTFFHFSDEQQPELNKKIMENLCDSANNGCEDTYDVLYLPTGYEPNGRDFNELQNSSVPLSFKIPAADQDVDDLTLGKMLTEAYRGQVDYFVQGGVSVSQLSSFVRSDRSGQPDGEMVDRSGQPDECNSSKAQIWTLLEEQRQTIIAEYRKKSQSSRTPISSSRRRAPTPTRTVVATEIGISSSSSTKSYRDGRITEISEFCLRYKSKNKTHRGSEHYFGALGQSTGIAKMK